MVADFIDAKLKRAWQVAAAVPDPELPFLTVHDLGILRDVDYRDGRVIAHVSPTYSGCPAVSVIEDNIVKALQAEGFDASVERVMSPAWSTRWITELGRQKLLANGIAPPLEKLPAIETSSDDSPLPDLKLFSTRVVACPQCGSDDTELLSEFGSTPCKAQHRCKRCLEPFDYFKCL